MIFDNIKNSGMYIGVNKAFEKAFDFIVKATDENFPAGRYEIDGDAIYASVQEYTTKLGEGASFEGHHKYIDIQYIADGVEVMEVADIDRATPSVPYDVQYDAEFFECDEKTQRLVLQSGDFAVFYPHDLHKPGLSFEGKNAEVKKIVVKVAL